MESGSPGSTYRPKRYSRSCSLVRSDAPATARPAAAWEIVTLVGLWETQLASTSAGMRRSGFVFIGEVDLRLLFHCGAAERMRGKAAMDWRALPARENGPALRQLVQRTPRQSWRRPGRAFA